MVGKLRFYIQNFFFIFLMYGGRLGIRLGHSLPCFACPYVSGCAGHCYLMALQSRMGFGLAFPDFFTQWGLNALLVFLFFILLFVPFSKTWCGWVCPFGTLQDWFTALRRKLGIRESGFSRATRERLKIIKYILLAVLILIPVFIANFGLHTDFALPFCQICPAKPLLPLFA